MALFGASAYVWALTPVALARALNAPLRCIVAASIIVAALSALGWLGLEAASMGEGWADALNPGVLGLVLTDTAFGAVWRWRLGLLALFLIALATGRHDRWPLVAPASAVLLASLGLAGRAIMQARALRALLPIHDAPPPTVAPPWLRDALPRHLPPQR